jgi:hypothetical protein
MVDFKESLDVGFNYIYHIMEPVTKFKIRESTIYCLQGYIEMQNNLTKRFYDVF